MSTKVSAIVMMRTFRLKSTLLGAVAGLNIICAKIRLGSGNYIVEAALIFLLNISIERHHGSKLLESLMNGNEQLLVTQKNNTHERYKTISEKLMGQDLNSRLHDRELLL
jgi:hypothetical protein